MLTIYGQLLLLTIWPTLLGL